MSDMHYGNIDFPLSGAALTRLSGDQDKILVPRLQAYATYKQALARMVIKQLLSLNQTIELGEEGHEKSYEPSILKGEYSIKYRYFAESKESMIANASVSNAIGEAMSEDTKRRDIYKMQNPDGEKQKLDAQRAEMSSPINTKLSQVHALIDIGRDIQAKIAFQELLMMIRQVMAPPMPQMPAGGATSPMQPPMPTTRPQGKGNENLIDLFSKGGPSGKPKSKSVMPEDKV
jgi:hypothetical protein